MEQLMTLPSWVYFVAMFFIFWFFILRPKMNAQKKEEAFRSNLKKGEKIITIGGVHGKIIGIQENTVLLEIEGGGKVKIEKTAVLKSKK